MYPESLCYSCLCNNEYNSSIPVEDNLNCHKIDCGITLRNTGRLSEGCVPIYYKEVNCCPIGWRCPEEKHLQEITDLNTNKTEPICKFGKLELNIGEKLEIEQEKQDCQECICTVPPMLHCIEKC